MSFTTKSFASESDLAQHLKAHRPSFFFSSRTSTVIPYDKLTDELAWEGSEFFLADLSKIPPKMSLHGDNLVVRGAVNWQDADAFLRSKGRAIMTSPTEQLALIPAGVATSCTGERCFSFGNMRKQVVRLKYLDHSGVEKELLRNRPFPHVDGLDAYQEAFSSYADFKNAPYPRFQTETDLMIGTEGQLGIVTEVEIETAPNFDVNHVFLLLPRWEHDDRAHMEIYQKVQSYRQEIISCELLDANCMDYLKPDERLGQKQDVIFLEIKSEAFENIYLDVLANLEFTAIDNVFEISAAKFHQVRAGVPRAVFEENSKMGVKKMGTDCQVRPKDFPALLSFYRELARLGVRYNLFGHFGDAHLHFNYMPFPADTSRCQEQFLKLYDLIHKLHGSPFAEHGIGLLKQKFIKAFMGDVQYKVFRELKKAHDPHGQFFPQGFMSTLS